jgi:hypothetical protein
MTNPSREFTNLVFIFFNSRQDHILKTLDPNFPTFSIPSGKLCFNDYDRTIRIEIWDYSSYRADSIIGGVDTTLNQLLKSTKLPLLNHEKGKSPESGALVVQKILLEPCYTFVDYISGGHQISLMVAIDFTGKFISFHSQKLPMEKSPTKPVFILYLLLISMIIKKQSFLLEIFSIIMIQTRNIQVKKSFLT